MNEKKDITISLSTFFLIIAILIIGIMGVFIYNLDNEQKQANSKIEELNAEINNTQENVNNINTVVNETESVNEIKNSTEIFEIPKLLIKHISFLFCLLLIVTLLYY